MDFRYRHFVLVKWITCEVTDRAVFDLGQQAWDELHGVPGFLGQGGGWSKSRAGVAHIFGFWSDPASYQALMDGPHDRIAAVQTGSFANLWVRVLVQRLAIGSGFPAGLSEVSLLRLAHYQVREEHRADFVRAQSEVWNPGMATAPGMHGGVFTQDGDTEVLVLSAWRTAENHRRHLDERFGRLRETAASTAGLDAITGDVVNLEQNWTVHS